MADPDDMSAASDDESVLGVQDTVSGQVDSDDDDVHDYEEAGDCDMLDDDPQGDDGGVPQADPDDDDEGADEEVPKQTKGGISGIMKHFYKAQGEKKAAAKPESATASETNKKRSTLAASTADPVPLGKHGSSKAGKARDADRGPASAPAPAPAPAARAGGGGAAKKVKELKGSKDASAPKHFAFHDSDDEEETLDVTLPKNAGLTMSAPDAEQEFEDQTLSAGNAGAAAEDNGVLDPPSVSELAKKRRYVMKNEKVKKWAEFKCAGLRFAPDCDELFEFTLDDLTIASKKDRLVMQDKLVNEQMTKVLKTLCIAEVEMAEVGSSAGPGITNLMAVIPSKLPLSGPEQDDIIARLEDYDEEDELVTLVALDHEIVKRVYKVQSGGGLPPMYNPNTNNSNKYRVPAKLEENAKSGTNFVMLGVVEKAKGTRKRGAEETAGGKSDTKRGCNGTPAKSVAGSSEPQKLATKEAQAAEARELSVRRRMVGGPGAYEQEVGTDHNEHMVVESVPLDDAANTHCWIMGNRLYWATPRAGSD